MSNDITLYEMTGELIQFQKFVEENADGLTPEAIADTMEGLTLAFNDKAVGVVMYARGKDLTIDAIDAEIERLKDRKKAIENQQQAMLDYLRMNMEAGGIDKIECPQFTITLAKAMLMVEIIDEKAIPDEFTKVKTEISVDKKALLDQLKKEEAARVALQDNPEALAELTFTPGARLAWSKRGLRIK